MTREEAISGLKEIRDWAGLPYCIEEPLGKEGVGVITTEMIDMAIKALEQEPRKDEIILTKEEYGELVSSEFDNGYTKGYTEALEQNDVLDKIRAEIEQLKLHKAQFVTNDNKVCIDSKEVLNVIDRYKAESEG